MSGFEVLKAVKDANQDARDVDLKKRLDDGTIEGLPAELWRALRPQGDA